MDTSKILWPGWKTVKLIGRGSFGEVYLIERKVFDETETAALKVISIPQNESEIEEMYGDGYDDESITSTFHNQLKSIVAEYSLMGKLKGCRSIVSCDDIRYVQHDDGIGWDVFIKMELLTPLLKAQPAENLEEMVTKLGSDICNALVACKEYDIVHRDIKPQNIFVSKYGDYKLGDFGIAKTVERTMGGTKIGTYKYMAPEVFNNQPYGSAADIYSVGLVMYWLLNERRMPFLPLPPEKINTTMEEKARSRRFQGEPLLPPAHGSEDLKKIVLKACAYSPNDRYATAAEMLRDLKEGFTDEETLRKREEERLRKEAEARKKAEEERLSKEVEERRKAEEERLCKEKEKLVSTGKKQQKGIHRKVENDKTKMTKNRRMMLMLTILVLMAFSLLLTFSVRSVSQNGWVEKAGKHQYYQSGEMSTGWEIIDGKMYFFDEQGFPVVGWHKANSNTTCYDKNGNIHLISAGTYYFDENGIMQTGWKTLNGKEHYFGEDGVLQPDYMPNIVAIGGAENYWVAVNSNGTVIYEGTNDFLHQTESWTDIAAVSAANTHLLGLKSDGTVVVAGDESLAPCDVSQWSNIVKISTCDSYTAGLQSDGTVVATKTIEGQVFSEVENWTGVTEISAGAWSLFACTSDRTVLMTGSTSSWENIVALSAGEKHVIGLKEDGTARADGIEESFGRCDVSEWSDLVAVSAGKEHTVGLKADGTVIAVGNNQNGQCDVDEWKQVTAIYAAGDYTLAVTEDGKLLCTKTFD